MNISPSDFEVMRHSFTAIPEQMGASLMRSAYSPNIKERKDESCAIFSPKGHLLAQAEHIPVHLGAMPVAVKVATKECKPSEGDQVILNNPFKGGTHLPDVTLIKPVYYNNEHVGYTVNRAHHADVGGDVPGSMPGDSKKLEEEGIIISPTLAVKDKKLNRDIKNLFKEMRSPKERIGDLNAQIGANNKGASEFIKTIDKFGLNRYKNFIEDYFNYSKSKSHKMIQKLPNGVFNSKDYLEWRDKEVKIKVQIEISDDELTFDFQGTSDQIYGNINAPFQVTLSAIYYILKCLLPKEVPLNYGSYDPIGVKAPEGSVVNAKPPVAVSAGNVETSQRIVELILRALEPALPDKIPAESTGSMNNLAIGNDRFTYYETIGGGAGATSKQDGEDGVHVHMTNTKNTPIEALENYYPLKVDKYKLRNNSGGKGKYNGGEGLIREIKVKEDSKLSIQSERRKNTPKGAKKGENGKKGKNILIKGNQEIKLNSKVSRKIKKSESIRICTPGGGGWGKN
ncbi:MAG: N-methylhydantoinase B/acetone carboxylase, alpha subunit [Candidatus Methanohalarchaeum thermophilum]|uniref:N-methylhydantoinase B/acetone carboxylase, alpha subunit n=1 Tax=Methanohalarchaeum thermophilum TaxID=1903181 RepID=A0A1Q6DXB5_METT1|nr:MAG: N-methylhydantoinase B/acetone carboxylase, alpha subunit [Candidatus Methanohalarchaeum thermophilum]